MKRLLIALMIITGTTNCLAEDIHTSATEQSVSIYFVRHGKTLLNTFDRVQGWADSPLTKEGIQGARYLGEGIKGIKFDKFYSSDAGRQRETMAVITRQAGISNYHLTELPGLREAFFGSFEGGYNKDMAQAVAQQLKLSDANELFRKMKSGALSLRTSQNALAQADPQGMAEDFAQVKARTQAALSTIVQQSLATGAKNVLAVSSGTAIQIMISDLTEDAAKNKPLTNTAVVKVIYKNGHYSVPEIGTLKYSDAGKKALSE